MGNIDDHNHGKNLPEHGYGKGYQQSVKVECNSLFGMDPDEFYRRQVGLVTDEIPQSLCSDGENLEKRPIASNLWINKAGQSLFQIMCNAGMRPLKRCNLDLGPGKKVLDLAVGQGDTSRYLATTGADVEARDIEDFLVNRAQERDYLIREMAGIDEVQESTREVIDGMGDVNYELGNYGEVKKSVEAGQTFDAITVMSRSFMYLLERDNYERALKDFYDLLNTGGKIVIQSRQCVDPENRPWEERLGTSVEALEDHSMVMRDNTGTEYVCESLLSETDLDDGVKMFESPRYVRFPTGKTQPLGIVKCDNRLELQHLWMWKEMLETAGFKNVGIKIENLTESGSEIMFAIVAERP